MKPDFFNATIHLSGQVGTLMSGKLQSGEVPQMNVSLIVIAV
jgi:hypothetical protein